MRSDTACTTIVLTKTLSIMLRWYYNHKVGYINAKSRDGKSYKLNIFGGNCLCVITYIYKQVETGRRMEQLVNFYVDESHIKNIIKEYKTLNPVENIKSVYLNTYYKQSFILAKHLSKSGHKVVLYYEEPKKK